MSYAVSKLKWLGVAGGVFIVIAVTLFLIFGGNDAQEEIIDVTKYELPAALQEYIKENPKIQNSYISGTKVYTATEQEIKNTTVYTYYVLHLLLPEAGMYYDIEDKTGTSVEHFEGDSQDYVYNTEEIHYPQMMQLVKDKKGNFSVYTY